MCIVTMPVIANSDAEILQCFPVMSELRPHLVEGEFVARIRRQQAEGGYQLAFLAVQGRVRALAGFRIGEFLAWGRILYVDDLVTTSEDRSRGHGRRLFDWLTARAREAGCGQLHLDSGVQRFSAHRFYLRHRMDITAHHFALNLG
jgi:GNAT superfamily N-acetyltransferase